MLKTTKVFLFAYAILLVGCSPKVYEDYFSENRLRFDYKVEGTETTQAIAPLDYVEERTWGGSKINLVDTFEYGEYMVKLFDAKKNRLIYSRGFSDLFVEWQTTAGAKTNTMSYNQTVLLPFPKKEVRLEMHKRDSNLQFKPLFVQEINPDTIFPSPKRQVETESVMVHEAGNPKTKLDIAMLAEGYTESEKNKFYSDAERFKEYLFGWAPYDTHRDDINIHAVFAASKESGVDIPGDNVWKETIVDAHFYTFGIERYLTVPDLTKVYDCLSDYPVDQVVVLVNSDKYGGGGFYNFYNVFTSDNPKAELLFLHEFGHGFAGLADEYFEADVAYESFGSAKYEPYQPNITNMVDFDSKWKGMVLDTVPVPTPDTEAYDKTVGVFEGANYQSKGFYRPYRTCAMRSSEILWFCPVCEKSIEQMILFYSK